MSFPINLPVVATVVVVVVVGASKNENDMFIILGKY